MPLKSLLVIALRLFAIYWFIEGISALAVITPVIVSTFQVLGWSSVISYALIPFGLLGFTILIWFCANPMASLVARGHEAEINFTSLTKRDLYSFAFVFLGLFFILSSLAITVQAAWQYFAFEYPLPDDNPQKGHYLWPLMGHLLTMAAGFGCLFGARKWTDHLIRRDVKNDSTANP